VVDYETPVPYTEDAEFSDELNRTRTVAAIRLADYPGQ